MVRTIEAVTALLFLLSATLAGSEQELVYKRYVNIRFGYGVSYPQALLIPQGEADNNDGQKFLSKEGDVELAVWGTNNVFDETLQSKFQNESMGHTKEHPDLQVTYKKLGINWFVVSGFIDGKVFYQKTIFDDETFLTCYITYPPERKQVWDQIAATISKSFKYLGSPERRPSPTK